MFTMHLSEEWLEWYSGHSSDPIPSDVFTHLHACDDCKARLGRVCPSGLTNPGTGPPPIDRRREPRVTVNEGASIKMLSPIEAEPVNIRVLDVSRNGLKIWTPTLLERGTMLQVRMGDMIIMGEVRHWAAAGAGFHAGLYIEDCIERRTCPRTQAQMPATILSGPSTAEPKREYPAKILNRSNKGMLVAVPHRIPPGAAVQVVSEGRLFLAEVLHCRAAEDGFEIGIEVDQALAL